MRAFIALDVSEEMRDDCAALARQLAASVDARFMPRANYHLTLAFLGDIGEAQARDALDALHDTHAAWATRTADPQLLLTPEGLGSFGRPHDATLWLGFERTPELMSCADELRAALDTRGLPYDRKAFLPHLTLARRARLTRGALSELAFPMPDVAPGITLYKSELSRDGASYKPLYTLPLA